MSEINDEKSSPIYFVLEWTPKQESDEYDLTVTPCRNGDEALETVSKSTSPIRCVSTANPLTGEGCEQ
jgi:hypothetical protein